MGDNMENSGLSRRSVIKRGAVAGGALAWATPTVITLTQQAAFANISAVCGPGCSGPGNFLTNQILNNSACWFSKQVAFSGIVTFSADESGTNCLSLKKDACITLCPDTRYTISFEWCGTLGTGGSIQIATIAAPQNANDSCANAFIGPVCSVAGPTSTGNGTDTCNWTFVSCSFDIAAGQSFAIRVTNATTPVQMRNLRLCRVEA